MSFRTIIPVTMFSICLIAGAGQSGGVTWQEVLDRAEKVLASGDPDSALVLVEAAKSKALTELGRSDTTVEIRVYRGGIPETYYFRSYDEAEMLYGRILSVKERTLPPDDLELARALMELAAIYAPQRKYDQVKPLCEQALAIREEALHPEHLDVALALRGLADAYLDLGEYGKAEELYQRSLAIQEKALGSEDLDVAATLNSLGITYFNQGRYSECELAWKRALTIREAVLGSEHTETAVSLSNLGVIYEIQTKYDAAEALYKRALAITEKAFGPDHPDVAENLSNLAILHRYLGRYEEAYGEMLRVLEIKERAYGPENLDVALALNNLADIQWYRGEVAQCVELMERATAIYQRTLGPDHRDVAMALENLGVFYADVGHFGRAKELMEQALEIREKVLGAEHPEVALNLNNLANLHTSLGRYLEAEPLHMRALAIFEKVYGPEHPDVALALDNLAALYTMLCRYAESEPLSRRALGIRTKLLGNEHTEVASNLNNLGYIYHAQGRYAEAAALYERALAIREKVLGPNHPDLATSLSRVASISRDMGDYAKAESLYTRVLAIREEVLGQDHPKVAPSLANLAILLSNQGRSAEAEVLLERALRINEQILGPWHPNVADILNGLGRQYMSQGRYVEAEEALRRALAVTERSAGPEHPLVAPSLGLLSTLNRLENNSIEALELAARASGITRNSFADNARVMSEKNALTYSRVYKRCIDAYLTCYSEVEMPDSLRRIQAADLIVSSKGQVSDGISQRQKSLVGETDSTTLALAEDLRLVRFQLAELFVEGREEDMERYRNELDSLSHMANDLEAALSRHSASFKQHQDHERVNTARIASLLPENSALVEYVRYDYGQLQPRTEIPHYMVVVILPDGQPVMADLGEAKYIDALIDKYRVHMLQVASAGRMPTAVDRETHCRISEQLHEMIWHPIEDHVRGRELLLIAPDGALNLISFAGLWSGGGRYLIEESAIHYLSSGRDVIGLVDETESGSGLFALGDPDYDASVATRVALAAAAEDTVVELDSYAMRNVRSGCGKLTDITVEALPGTRNEIETIVSGWRRLTDEPVTVHFGPEATEDRFKAEAAGERVIHLATHGYFFESRCQPENSGTWFEWDTDFVGENPLLLSGLFLAGANLHGEGADSLGAEDGILTAYEVSAMDLDGTELVVLSACETGLGKVEQGEGVYGLRRAFQMAGARTVVSALWPVSDTAAAEIMSGLYERQNQSLPETMRRTQLKKIIELRRSSQPDHPFTWAGFIALGGWD